MNEHPEAPVERRQMGLHLARKGRRTDVLTQGANRKGVVNG